MNLTDEEVKRRIAINVRKARGGLSLRDVGNLCATYPTTIKQIEDGERMPGLGMAFRVANALGVTIMDLVQPVPEAKRIKRKPVVEEAVLCDFPGEE